AAVRWRRMPALGPRREIQREEPAALLRIEPSRLPRLVDDDDVGEREVDVAVVGCEAPLDAAQQPAGAELLLPDDRALAIGIERVDLRRLLPHQDDALLRAGGGGEDWSGAEVVVRACILGTVRLVPADAREVPHVVRPQLLVPEDASRREIERDGGIAHRRGRLRVVVAGPDVHGAALGIDDGRGPDGDAGRPEHLHAALADANLLRLLDQVCLPDAVTGERIERDDGATERAARVLRIGARAFLV